MEASQSGGKLGEDDAGVDRLSELPDHVLVGILVRLDDAAAASRTSVLSSRWRYLCLHLPELRFPLCSKPRLVAAALAAHEAALSYLSVGTLDADAESVASWLPAVACRLTGHLSFTNDAPGRDIDDNDDGGEERGSLELPCLASATSVTLDLGCGLGLVVPPAGVFARLTDISLTSVLFRGQCALGDAVSSPRCPCLLKLTVRRARGLDNLTVRSDSLREMTLERVRGLDNLTVRSDSLRKMTLERVRGLERIAVASPALEYLTVFACFMPDWVQPVADISAPALKVLRWGDLFDPISVHLGTMGHLECLCTNILCVYGNLAVAILVNSDTMELLRCFKSIQHLDLTLAYQSNIDDMEYLMEDMTILPDIMTLDVRVIANGHAFGASLFHVLRLCSGIKELILDLSPRSFVAQDCLPGCICNEKEHWKTEQLLLNHLQEVEITGLRGSQYEVTLLKQLFSWATVLKKITVTFDHSLTESMAKELCQMFRLFSRPEICMKFQLGGSSSGEDGNSIQPINY